MPTHEPSARELVDQFLADRVALGRSPKTVQTYRERLARFTAWLGDRPITRATVRGYLADLQQQPLSPVSVASYFRDVKVFCLWLVEEKILTDNPTRKLAPKVPKRKPASYSVEQITQLLTVCDERDRALIIMLLDTGLRAGELCSLDRADVDWRTGAFRVIGKGNKERTAWLSAYALETVRVYLDTRTDDDPALWIGAKGRLTRYGVRQMLARRARQAGIRGDVRRLTHSFRVTFAKNYLVAGGDLESLRRLLGHSSIAMAAHYAQLAEDELADQKRRVNPLARAIPEAR